ncbi:roadblock/LC7 domain-containing protein [Streptomyces sulphureus]|uniref:roadblock/LC7 domain-containing protein n=1 Tax=Streptomyces sulphureus TaxID=47758 RepID=UPI0003A79542|nr:roadblock/LC7 domain-containing protein [Streptomyces sulphureus]
MAQEIDNSWMVQEVVDVSGVRHVVVLSADGLPTAKGADTDRETAEWIAAAASGLASLGKGSARKFGTGRHVFRQSMQEFEGGFLFVRIAGDGSCLAVVTRQKIDAGQIGTQMKLQIDRFGDHQGTPSRQRVP